MSRSVSKVFVGIIHPPLSSADDGVVGLLSKDALMSIAKQVNSSKKGIPLLFNHAGGKTMLSEYEKKHKPRARTMSDMYGSLRDEDWHGAARKVEDSDRRMAIIGTVQKIYVPEDMEHGEWKAQLRVDVPVAAHFIEERKITGLSISSVGDHDYSFATEVSLCIDPARNGCFVLGEEDRLRFLA